MKYQLLVLEALALLLQRALAGPMGGYTLECEIFEEWNEEFRSWKRSNALDKG